MDARVKPAHDVERTVFNSPEADLFLRLDLGVTGRLRVRWLCGRRRIGRGERILQRLVELLVDILLALAALVAGAAVIALQITLAALARTASIGCHYSISGKYVCSE